VRFFAYVVSDPAFSVPLFGFDTLHMIKEKGTPIVPQPASLKAWWALLRPFWTAEKKWLALGMVAALLTITFSQSYVRLALTRWMGHYRQAVSQYDAGALPSLFLLYGAIFALEIGVSLALSFLNASLGIVWRTWLTKRFLQRWMRGKAFYWIEQERLVDNPDQRITEDIDLFVTVSLTLFLGLFGTITSLVVFTPVLWTKSGPMTLSLGSVSVQIEHYMVWLAILYALVTSVIVQFAGRRLQPLTFRKQQAEANFRFMMTGIREHAEQIAMLGGGATEVERLHGGFEAVRHNFWQLVFFNMRFQPITLAMALTSAVFASFALLPRYLAHQISFGDMTQLEATFSIVASSLQWFIQNFTVVQQYRVVVARLGGLDTAIDLGTRPRGPEYARLAISSIRVNGLDLDTPQGHRLLSGLTFSVHPGERWLIKGPSGAGKSTLLRALAGIWHHGAGDVSLPADAKTLFLPQKNYLPPGSLKAALCYPSAPDAFDDEWCRRALTDCQLAHLVDHLEETAHWGHRLSPGEQQRIGFARIVLQRPNYVLLDESTSALDEDNETYLYRVLVERFPHMAIVSVSHHRGLDAFHDHTLQVAPANIRRTGGSVPVITVPHRNITQGHS
jgi:putative ATP-binding cassette transporter